MRALEILIETLLFVAVGLIVAIYLSEPELWWLMPASVLIASPATVMSINTFREIQRHH